jgi:hypothetical protein
VPQPRRLDVAGREHDLDERLQEPRSGDRIRLVECSSERRSRSVVIALGEPDQGETGVGSAAPGRAIAIGGLGRIELATQSMQLALR